MGWENPPVSWSDLERTLSDRHRGGKPIRPAWSRKRPPPESPYEPPREVRPAAEPDRSEPAVPYAELHCHSTFSFLDGAHQPETLVAEARRLGLTGLALTDHDGFYGVPRMVEAIQRSDGQRSDGQQYAGQQYAGPAPVFGAELSLGLTVPQNGVADPEGSHLLVLARGAEGYHRLAGAITDAQLRGAEKGRPVYDLEELAASAGGPGGHWLVLTGCRKGLVPQALEAGVPGRSAASGRRAAARQLDRLVDLFGRDNVAVELIDHGYPLDSDRNDALAELAADARLPTVATNNVHYATPAGRRLATALAAVRARRSLDEIDGWLPAAGTAYLRSGAEMAARFARYPGAVARTADYARELTFDLVPDKPRLPSQDVPDGETPMSWLRTLVRRGAVERYLEQAGTDRVRGRLDAELAVIEKLDFPGYFLIVHDIVTFAKGRGILCQGRGSAANSAVCYVLGITAVDAIRYELPFERFLSALRDEEPDIDVDFDSDHREEVIQHVYGKYGRRNAAQVANVITYRPKLAVRDMAKALGYSPGQQDAWSKQMDSWGSVPASGDTKGGSHGDSSGDANGDHDVPAEVIELAGELLTFPRHLGIHSGGMVLTDRPVGEVCPIEPARMADRTVLQWDKDDCAVMKLVKFDLLGLGILAALQYTFDLVAEHLGEKWELATIPAEEPGVYDMLCRADSVGVFQVESRAQMATLPRLQPREFYELAIEIALIRPGPIQGGAVHPYIRRKLGQEKITYLHDDLISVLERTKGVPLFQEQLMQMAMEVGGCTGADADLLRRAMGSKRGVEKIERLRAKLYAGMADHGITGDLADEVYSKIEAFANFGFAESHAISFALLVYASAWLRLHYPAAFLAALLRAQPMGFYSPQSLVADARRHGVTVLGPDIHASGAQPGLESLGDGPVRPSGRDECLARVQRPVGEFDPAAPPDHAAHRRDAGLAVRLGLAGVTSIGSELAARIVAERDTFGCYTGMGDLVRRTGLTAAQVEALATAGAFAGFGLSRREALWAAGHAAQERPDQLPGLIVGGIPARLPEMNPAEQVIADLWASRISPDDDPTRHVRAQLDALGVVSAARLREIEHGRRVLVGGVVTHRQRPSTAGGVTFLNLEDETGMVNVICSAGVWARYRRAARDSPALLIRGRLERAEGVTNILADRIDRLPLTVRTMSRDFR